MGNLHKITISLGKIRSLANTKCKEPKYCPNIENESLCCISCNEFQECKTICEQAEDWDIKLIKCPLAIIPKREGVKENE